MLCSSGGQVTLTVPLATQGYRWPPVNLTLGASEPCDGLASHPKGSKNTPSRFMPLKPEISAGIRMIGHLARVQTLSLPLLKTL